LTRRGFAPRKAATTVLMVAGETGRPFEPSEVVAIMESSSAAPGTSLDQSTIVALFARPASSVTDTAVAVPVVGRVGVVTDWLTTRWPVAILGGEMFTSVVPVPPETKAGKTFGIGLPEHLPR
jgi:hypothetical protein